MPSAPKPGEPITSAFLQDVDRRAGGRPSGGTGSPIQVGSRGQLMVPGSDQFFFVECTEDFSEHSHSNPGTGKCKFLNFDLDKIGEEFEVDSLINDPVVEDQFWIIFNRVTGRYEVLGAGGCGSCEEVHEVRLEGVVTGSTFTLTYTIGGVTGSAATINYNDTSIDVASSVIASHPAFTADNLLVFDGPFPNVAVYLRFSDDLAGRRHPLPVPVSSLTGTGAIVKVGRFTSPGLGT